MPRTVRDLITRAARIATAIGAAEPLDANDANDLLTSVNMMLDSWRTQRLYAFAITELTHTLSAGATSHGIGPAASINTTVRPVKIEYAFTRDAQNYDRPMQVLSQDEYANIFLKTLEGAYPVYVSLDPAWPIGQVRIWPAPAAGVLPLTLRLGVWTLLNEFTQLSDVVSLPPGYEDAITYSLAERACIEFEKEVSKGLEKAASVARAAIKRVNVQPSRASVEFQSAYGRNDMIPWWVIKGGG
jgi:hypothetical protein